MFDTIKARCGIAKNVKIYDDDIHMYMSDSLLDLRDSGVTGKNNRKCGRACDYCSDTVCKGTYRERSLRYRKIYEIVPG